MRKLLLRKLQVIKQRCYNKNHNSYNRYGGRGIKVCEEWLNNPENFINWSLSSGYKKGLSIDRIDHLGNYCPENCRWLTIEENRIENVRRNLSNGAGAWDKNQKKLTKTITKQKQGRSLIMIDHLDEERNFQCLIDAAEYICSLKNLKTKPIQIKKNISACLNGKRKTCHGFKFKDQNLEF